MIVTLIISKLIQVTRTWFNNKSIIESHYTSISKNSWPILDHLLDNTYSERRLWIVWIVELGQIPSVEYVLHSKHEQFFNSRFPFEFKRLLLIFLCSLGISHFFVQEKVIFLKQGSWIFQFFFSLCNHLAYIPLFIYILFIYFLGWSNVWLFTSNKQDILGPMHMCTNKWQKIRFSSNKWFSEKSFGIFSP